MKLNKINWIIRANEIHGNKYDYSNATYSHAKEPVDIKCNSCGLEFKQSLHHHIVRKQGCPSCSYIQRGLNLRVDFTTFLKRASDKNKDIFEYDEESFSTMSNNTNIKCVKHDFWFSQCAKSHTYGIIGCPLCKEDFYKTFGLTKKSWIKICKRKNIRYPILYIVKLLVQNEEFVKIGITTNTIKERQYEWKYPTEIINSITGNPESIWDLETKLHRLFKKYQVFPAVKFSGHTECFSLDILKDPNFQILLQN